MPGLVIAMSLVTLAVGQGQVFVMKGKVSDWEWEHFQLLNKQRAAGFVCPDGKKYGPYTTPLKFGCRLWRAAYAHSWDMSANDYYGHVGKNYSSPFDRARNWQTEANAENIHAGTGSDPKTALKRWSESLGHCVSMMNAKRRVVGIGWAAVGGKFKNYWTQLFRNYIEEPEDMSCYPGATGPPPKIPPPSGPTPWPFVVDKDDAIFRSKINYLRCLHDAPALPWSAELADMAAKWKGIVVRSTGLQRNVLFWASPGTTPDQAIEQTYAWGATAAPGTSQRKMYETMLWKSSKEMGCARSTSAYWTCFFQLTSTATLSSASNAGQVGPKTKSETQCRGTGDRSVESESAPVSYAADDEIDMSMPPIAFEEREVGESEAEPSNGAELVSDKSGVSRAAFSQAAALVAAVVAAACLR